jgi:hypothetical protein
MKGIFSPPSAPPKPAPDISVASAKKGVTSQAAGVIS